LTLELFLISHMCSVPEQWHNYVKYRQVAIQLPLLLWGVLNTRGRPPTIEILAAKN